MKAPSYFFGLLLVLSFALTACGSFEEPPPTRLPTATPTKISTPLPPVPTAIPVGTTRNPLRFLVVPPNFSAASGQERAFETVLNDLDGLEIDLQVVARPSQALEALCDPAIPAVVWVDGLAYGLASLRGCGTATLQLRNLAGQTGEASTFFINAAAEVTGSDYQTIAAGVFCRTSLTDFYSWTVPMVVFRTQSIDIAALQNIDEFPNYDQLLANVGRGRCTGAAVPQDIWAAWTNTSLVRRVGDSFEIPYGVLVIPNNVPIDAIESLKAGLLNLDGFIAAESTPEAEATPDADTQNNAELLDIFLGAGRLEAVEDSDFQRLRNFLNGTGLNFVELGS